LRWCTNIVFQNVYSFNKTDKITFYTCIKIRIGTEHSYCENIRKQFENAAEGNETKSIVSPKKVPRPVSSVLPNNGNTPSNQDIARKRIENVIGNGSKPLISPKRIPPKLVSNVSQNVENSKNNTELKSTQEQILQKRRQSQESCPSPILFHHFPIMHHNC
jgi:capsid portal protein